MKVGIATVRKAEGEKGTTLRDSKTASRARFSILSRLSKYSEIFAWRWISGYYDELTGTITLSSGGLLNRA